MSGIKDQVRGLFSVWSDIFHRADKAKYIKALTGENQLKRVCVARSSSARWHLCAFYSVVVHILSVCEYLQSSIFDIFLFQPQKFLSKKRHLIVLRDNHTLVQVGRVNASIPLFICQARQGWISRLG